MFVTLLKMFWSNSIYVELLYFYTQTIRITQTWILYDIHRFNLCKGFVLKSWRGDIGLNDRAIYTAISTRMVFPHKIPRYRQWHARRGTGTICLLIVMPIRLGIFFLCFTNLALRKPWWTSALIVNIPSKQYRCI